MSHTHFTKLVTAPKEVEDISKTLKQLTLSGVKPEGWELGRGAYGKVYTVKYRGVVYAAKEVHALLLPTAGVEMLRNNFICKCSQCSKLNHDNVVQLVGIYYSDYYDQYSYQMQSLPVMVMELMDARLTAYATWVLV